MESLTIDELNNEPEITPKDVVWFTDVINSIFDENCADEDDPASLKARAVIQQARDENMSQKAFREMVKSFVMHYEYPKWRPANVWKYRKVSELHNEDWYIQQLATTELNPEHFEIFLVENRKMYCYKKDAHKVNLSEKVQLYKPKMIKRQIEEPKPETRSEQDKLITKLTNENLELRHENEQLRRDIFIATGKKVDS